MGLHGEPGIERTDMQPANLLVDKMYRTIKEEMDLSHNNEVAVLVNGLGSTTLLELSIVYNELQKHLEKKVYRYTMLKYNNSALVKKWAVFLLPFLN